MTPITMDRNLLWAWVCLILVPAAVLPAVLVGETLTALLGYGVTHTEAVALGPALVAGIPTLVICLLPGIGALVFGLRATAGGHRLGLLPAALGALSILYWLAVNVAGLLSLGSGGI